MKTRYYADLSPRARYFAEPRRQTEDGEPCHVEVDTGPDSDPKGTLALTVGEAEDLREQLKEAIRRHGVADVDPLTLAESFSWRIRARLNRAQLAKVVQRNREDADDRVCHTHDFIDANVVMGGAFKEVVGRESEPASEVDAELWNDAWYLAKRRDFGTSVTGVAPTIHEHSSEEEVAHLADSYEHHGSVTVGDFKLADDVVSELKRRWHRVETAVDDGEVLIHPEEDW